MENTLPDIIIDCTKNGRITRANCIRCWQAGRHVVGMKTRAQCKLKGKAIKSTVNFSKRKSVLKVK